MLPFCFLHVPVRGSPARVGDKPDKQASLSGQAQQEAFFAGKIFRVFAHISLKPHHYAETFHRQPPVPGAVTFVYTVSNIYF